MTQEATTTTDNGSGEDKALPQSIYSADEHSQALKAQAEKYAADLAEVTQQVEVWKQKAVAVEDKANELLEQEYKAKQKLQQENQKLAMDLLGLKAACKALGA